MLKLHFERRLKLRRWNQGMASVTELKYFGDQQTNFKILKPWWDVFTEYLTVLMLMVAVFGISMQITPPNFVSRQLRTYQTWARSPVGDDSPWTTKTLSDAVYNHPDQKYLTNLTTKKTFSSISDITTATDSSLPQETKSSTEKLSEAKDLLPLENVSVTHTPEPSDIKKHLLDKKEAEQAKALFEKVKKFRLHTEDGDILYKMYIRQTIFRFFQTLCILSYVTVLAPRMNYIIHCVHDSQPTGCTDFFCIHGLFHMFRMLSFSYIAILILYSFTCLYTLYWIFFFKLKEYSFENVREETNIKDIPDVKNDFAFLLHLIDQYDRLYAKHFAIFLSDVSESKLLQINLNFEWTENKLLQHTVINANNKYELHLLALPAIPSTVYDLPNLDVLKLEMIFDANIEPIVSKLASLREIWILNSTVKVDSKALQFLKHNLQVVHIRFDSPNQIPLWIYNLKKMRELFFEGSLQLDSKTALQSFRELENLRSLHFKSNFTKVPIVLLDIANHLHHLSIHNQKNRLKDLTNMKKLCGLSSLKLVQCELERIPSEVLSLHNLQDLNLKDNNLSNMNEVMLFHNLKKLTSLQLHYNAISVISPHIAKVTFLELLNLNNNKLTDLPPKLFQLTRLRHLALSYNHISSIPKNIAKLHNLQVFTIDHNQLSELPEELFACTNLRVLIVSHNNIDLIPPAIGNLMQLRHLELFENKYEILPAEIGNCPFLRRSQLLVEEEIYTTLPEKITLSLQGKSFVILEWNLVTTDASLRGWGAAWGTGQVEVEEILLSMDILGL
ncbi:volume-regulated anion channel subunit LRRC8A-like [Rhinophrynus dorsalis]